MLWLNEKAQTRLQSINRGLPQALDLVVLSMGAGPRLHRRGAPRRREMERQARSAVRGAVRFLHELSLGKTRKEALEDLAYRAPTELVKAFVTNAIQAEKRGTPLVEILRIQADVARTKRFQTAEKVAGRAGVVILMPLMFIFAATVLVMFGEPDRERLPGTAVSEMEGERPFTLLGVARRRAALQVRLRSAQGDGGAGRRRRSAHRACRGLARAVPPGARRRIGGRAALSHHPVRDHQPDAGE